MSSSVFFRFKSQKEPSRVAFDGTGISVFELKREIISLNGLGDGTDFELVISSEDAGEEYDDDTSIIPRSTTVIAKRLPAAKAGRGGAARYVSGKMPQNAKNSHRLEALTTKPSNLTPANMNASMNGAQTEEEKIDAMFKMGADQWAQQQQAMANATPVHRSGPMKGKPQNQTDRPPPPGYICYRCGEKGHWIMSCPTNNDPAYDGRPRVKRTTGIPRSFLKIIEKPTTLANDGTLDDTKQPSGVMVNADGEWVIAEPDKAAWDRFQAKAKVSAAAQEASAQGSKELEEKGLECSIDKRLFLNPTKTPCCQKTFCHECIIAALLENDLRCPECSTGDVPIDNLTPDQEMVAKIHQYEEEKNDTAVTKDSQNTFEAQRLTPDHQLGSPNSLSLSKAKAPDDSSKKRPAESELTNERKPPGPADTTTRQTSSNATRTYTRDQMPGSISNDVNNQQVSFSNGSYSAPSGVNAMGFPNMNGLNGMTMGMGPTMGMNMVMQNPLMGHNTPFINTDWNNIWGGGFTPQGMNMGNVGFQYGMVPNGNFNRQHVNSLVGATGPMNMNSLGMKGMNEMAISNGQGSESFANQQRTSFGNQSTNEEDNAYMRMPVNPHRHQGRRNVNRPTDYREI